ncbi:MAG: M23 family metallopeptidase [Acidobacteria bacterium]|nr:M23 family metallopeptidase [Acidobacteriota bacterium]
MKPAITILFWLWVTVISAGAQTEAPNPLTLTLEPERITNGAPCIFSVASSVKLKGMAATWQERRIFFDFDSRTRKWMGLAGVNIDTVAGYYPLALVATLADGTLLNSTYDVPVYQLRYPTDELEVAREFTSPSKATQKRIKAEQALKSRYFKIVTPQRLWRGAFTPPLNSVITDFFGIQRMFNGERQSVHQGLDFRAATGTPIAAMNSGVVLLARNFFYEGGMVVVDHGYGLLTLYLHLSALRVREGEAIQRGQVVGLSGATGRVTSEHLHVGVRWQGTYIDPAKLFQLSLPQ